MNCQTIELIYLSEKCCLHFVQEHIQILIINSTDISRIIHFTFIGLDNSKIYLSSDLTKVANSFHDLVMVGKDSMRHPGFSAELFNKIKLTGDFNLSFIYALDPDHLFAYASFIFETFGLNHSECKYLLLQNRNRIMKLTQKNGKLNYQIIPMEKYSI